MYWQSYKEYLASPVWQAQREKSFKLYGRFCLACGRRYKLQVHHASYAEPWGQEKIYHLMPLCDRDHEGVTRYIEEYKQEASMFQLTWRYIFSVRKLSTARGVAKR